MTTRKLVGLIVVIVMAGMGIAWWLRGGWPPEAGTTATVLVFLATLGLLYVGAVELGDLREYKAQETVARLVVQPYISEVGPGQETHMRGTLVFEPEHLWPDEGRQRATSTDATVDDQPYDPPRELVWLEIWHCAPSDVPALDLDLKVDLDYGGLNPSPRWSKWICAGMRLDGPLNIAPGARFPCNLVILGLRHTAEELWIRISDGKVYGVNGQRWGIGQFSGAGVRQWHRLGQLE